MNEFQTIVIVAALFIIFYLIGTVRNRRLLVRYSRIIKRQLQPTSDFIGFRPFGSSGFRAIINMKKEMPISKIEIAISLVDRENIMHYPLALFTKENDKVTVWAIPRSIPKFNLEILSKMRSTAEKRSAAMKLKNIDMEHDELNRFFLFSTSDENRSKNFLSEIIDDLLRVKHSLSYLFVDEKESCIFLTGKLTKKSLESLLEIVRITIKRIS